MGCRLALAIHGSRHSYGPCRGAGFLGMGVLASGVTATAAGLTSDATIAAGGLGLAIALYLLGLLLLPGAAGTVTTRLRRLLDGTGSGICLLFTAWLLVVSPHGGLRPLPLAVALGTCAAVAVAVVTGLRAARYRPAALACAGGAGLSIVGLATVAIVLGTEIPDGSAWLATVPLVAGPVLADLGARRAGAGPDEPDPADEDGSLAGYPLLALPVGLAVLAAAYHLLVVGMLDRISTVLGIAGVAAIGLREALAAVDVRRYARRLTAQEAHFRSLVSGATEVTVVVDAELVVRWQSPAAARHFGLSDQDVVGRPFTALVHPDDVARVRAALRASEPTLIEARLRDGFGRWRDTESTVSDLRDAPEVAALVVHVRDVGERKELERTLHRMAFTDQLTGLANRRELLRAVAAARLTGTGRGAVLVIDLDGLAGINDLRGHEVGDAVLIEVARRLRACVGDEGLPARVGGAEFAVLTARGPVFANTLADRLLTALGEPYRPPGATVHLSVSVGLAGLSGPRWNGSCPVSSSAANSTSRTSSCWT